MLMDYRDGDSYSYDSERAASAAYDLRQQALPSLMDRLDSNEALTEHDGREAAPMAASPRINQSQMASTINSPTSHSNGGLSLHDRLKR